MRAQTRLIGILTLTLLTAFLLLSNLQSETVTRTINKFPSIKQAWQARHAAVQSHMAIEATNGAACDADEKTCTAPYTSKDAPKDGEVKQVKDQTTTEYEDDKDKDGVKRPSSKDEDRDKDRGFTDAEQAEALERLEFKYGDEAKLDTKVLWMESTTTTAWGADPTEALDKEEEKARKMLEEEHGDNKKTRTGTATPREKGWRTTGFETKAKTTHKSLISGGGGNGTASATATGTGYDEVDEATVTGTARATSTGKKTFEELVDGDEEEEEEVAPPKKTGKPHMFANAVDDEETITTTTAKKTGKKAAPTEEAEPTATSKKGRWDD